MKKYIKIGLVICLFAYLLLGCSKLSNNPSSKVEELFSKYQMLDTSISNEITTILTNENLTTEQHDRYKKIIENQYKNLTYEIKDEVIDGNNAVVTVQVEVMDYKKIIQQLDKEYANQSYTLENYNNAKLDKLEKASENVIYTLELNVTKNNDGNWKLNSLSNIDKKKIQGMY